MKIKLLSVNISNFQNIAENQQVDFAPQGIYSIIGKNLDEGGSNASGKSSFVRALTVGILGPSVIKLSNKEMKNRITGLPPRIITEMTVDEKYVKIDRVIGGKLSVSIDGVELTGKTEEIQQKLMDFLKISPEHFLHLTCKMQGDFGGFLMMKDSEKKEFLGSFFDTDKILAAEEKNSSALKELNLKSIGVSEKIKNVVATISEIQKNINDLNQKAEQFQSTEYLHKIAKLKSDLTEKELQLKHAKSLKVDDFLNQDPNYVDLLNKRKEAYERLMALEPEVAQLNQSLNDRIKQIDSVLSSPIQIPNRLVKAIEESDSKIKIYENFVLTINRLEAQKASLQEKEQALRSKIANMKPDVCITCGQPINSDILAKIKSSIEAEIVEFSSRIKSINDEVESFQNKLKEYSIDQIKKAKEEALSEVAKIKAENSQEGLKNEKQMILSQLKSNADKVSSLKAMLSSLDSSIMSMRNSAEKTFTLEIQKVEAEVASLQKEIKLKEIELENVKKLLNEAQEKNAKSLADLAEYEQEFSKISKEIKIRNAAAAVLSRSGFIGYLFDNVLEEINARLNDNIKLMPVISRLSVYFSPDKQAKTTGTVSKSIVYKIIDKDGEVSFESLSGSEKQCVILAVDAAVDEVLANRLGVDINYKILDEQFGWVDSVNKNFLIDFLEQKYYDKNIMIVDHGSELNAGLKSILVVKENGVATICLNQNNCLG